MLLGFLKIADLEQLITIKGRTRVNIGKYRRYAKMYWMAIQNRCQAAMTGIRTTPRTDAKHEIKQWPPSHKLYEAARYVVENYKTWTYYLSEPRLPWTTNSEERGLRFEKCLLTAAKFKGNRNGRVILDILRTITATCIAAQVELSDYIKWVYLNRDEMNQMPEKYTPYEFAKHLDRLNTKDPTQSTVKLGWTFSAVPPFNAKQFSLATSGII